MYQAIHTQENKEAAREKVQAVAKKLREMKLKEAAKRAEDSIPKTLSYMNFPVTYWLNQQHDRAPKFHTERAIQISKRHSSAVSFYQSMVKDVVRDPDSKRFIVGLFNI